MIQKATLAQLPEILTLYDRARSFMAQTGNPDQWGNADVLGSWFAGTCGYQRGTWSEV